MKIAIADDIHLEFGPCEIRNTEGADVLVLAGDVCVASQVRTRDSSNKHSSAFHDFFDMVSAEFPEVIYVLGNHEHYRNDIRHTARNLRDRLADRKNVRVMEKETAKIGDVTFVGTTLWTDLNKRDPFTMWRIPDMMNDFRVIKDGVREDVIHNDPPRLTPERWCYEHDRCLSFLKDAVAKEQGKVVVVTHFTPSYMSCHPRYAGQNVMNAAYHTELHDYIWDNPHIALWIHGHTHDEFDYVINKTRVVCNPRGYVKYEPQAETWALKYVEV